MTQLNRNRSNLLLGCGAAALAIALAATPERAHAQAFQATETVQSGAAVRINTGTGTETIEVSSPTAIIDWVPDEDAGGNALDFLPTGNTATFQNGTSQNGTSSPDFAVLNRVLPATNENVTVFDGTVISQLFDTSGSPSPGGTVVFYSPTGILVGDNAVFDVGNLLLTTLDPDPVSFDSFAAGGTLDLVGASGTTAQITINPGALITATPENSGFVVAAAEVQMLGTSDINGSTAFIAGEAVSITASNGLFDIQIPVGTSVQSAMTIDGDVGGPSSTGVTGDNHMIYAVARAQADPISMLFSGNLGFDAAVSAGIVNGEIILSANYEVFGRDVDGGTISDGIDAIFTADSALTPVGGTIALETFNTTSDLLAIANDTVVATTNFSTSDANGNLLLVGRNSASVLSGADSLFSVTGDVLVSARDFGEVGFSGNFNAVGGTAVIDAFESGAINITGNVRVDASAVAGIDLELFQTGSATAGTAQIAANDGSVFIDGNAEALSQAEVFGISGSLNSDTDFTGGVAQFVATGFGDLTVTGNALAEASAFGADAFDDGSLGFDVIGGSAFGGDANISVFDSAVVDFGADVLVVSDGVGGRSDAASVGRIGDAGNAGLFVDGLGTADIAGNLTLFADGVGGNNDSAAGGDGLGGTARAFAPIGGTINIGGNFEAGAIGEGGDGIGGGTGSGGSAGIEVQIGQGTITGSAVANATGFGGNSSSLNGFGGDGGTGNGGLSFLQATGTLEEAASLSIGLDASVESSGFGGSGGTGDGGAIAAGNGGDGNGGLFADPNQADTNFNNGAFVLHGGDNATFTVGGATTVTNSGFGGLGGLGGPGQGGGNGGNGTGGTAQGGQALLSGDGSLGLGTADFGDISLFSNGVGGDGGFGGSTGDPRGDGGDGTGAFSLFSARAGSVTAGFVSLSSNGVGGTGGVGGAGTGGARAGMVTRFGGSIIVDGLNASAIGNGGVGEDGAGGIGQGGEAFIGFQDGTTQINGDAFIDATGSGGDSTNADGGAGSGGIADIAIFNEFSGAGTVTGDASVIANGIGGNVLAGTATGGVGTGGEAFVQAQAGGTVTLNTAQIVASGQGGTGSGAVGGDGFGGFADIRAFDPDSEVTVQTTTQNTLGLLSDNTATVSASGIGGETNGGSGIGGTGTGGEAVVAATNGATITLPDQANSVGLNTFAARGRGGDSTVDGGSGGQGIGGLALFEADNATISVAETNLSPFSTGGSGVSPQGTPINVSGGTATGGTRRISVSNGGTITGQFSSGISGGIGGSGIGNGNGGDGQGGFNELIVTNATFNSLGVTNLIDNSAGGQGEIGGEATGGTINVTATGGVINILTNDAGFDPELFIGGISSGGTGVSQGGEGQGSAVTALITESEINGGTLNIQSEGFGGEADQQTGTGGRGRGGSIDFEVSDSLIDLAGFNTFSTNGVGGAGSNGGQGRGGTAVIEFFNTALNIVAANSSPGTLSITSDAIGGSGQSATGPASAGSVSFVSNSANVALDDLFLSTNAFASASGSSDGGDAFGGFISANINDGSIVDIELLTLESQAVSGEFASAVGGSANVTVGNGGGQGIPDVDIVTLDLSVDAQDGFNSGPASNPGTFQINAISGDLRVTDLNASAQGDTLGFGEFGPPLLIANGASILISGNLLVDTLNDVEIVSQSGGLIGGPDPLDPSANIAVSSGGTIRISGDDDNFISFGGSSMALSSRDITVEPGARFGAFNVNLVSIDETNPAVIGGDSGIGKATGEGYVLSADEGSRIEADSVSFLQQAIGGSGPNDPDVIVRDLIAIGSLDDGISSLTLATDTGGIIRVEGVFQLVDAAPSDIVNIVAGDRIEVVTPGGLGILGSDGLPGGSLNLSANDIWVADSATIGQLQDNIAFTGRDDQLATAATGSEEPLGYIRAGLVSVFAENSLLVRNTGTETEPGGIAVTQVGGLSIFGPAGGDGLDVFAYGARIDPQSEGVITGEDFFNEVSFNNDGQSSGSTTYTEAAAFNDCLINTAECAGGTGPDPDPNPDPDPDPEPDPDPDPTDPGEGGSPLDELPEEEAIIVEQEVETVTTRTVVEASNATVQQIAVTEQETDNDFGMDFPGLVEAGSLDEEEDVEDAVASGGDSSLYGESATGEVEVEGN